MRHVYLQYGRDARKARQVVLDDHGDYLVVKPLPDDPVAAVRGALKGRIESAERLREIARRDEAAAEARRR